MMICTQKRERERERERERFSGRSYFIACVYSICKDIVTKDDDGDDDERERERSFGF